ncbi:MAG: META domain-containing protein [Rikenellaceae bacterium]
MTRLAKQFAIALIALFAILSCARRPIEPISGEWKIVSVDGADSVVNSPFILFNPQDSTIYGYSGCNRFFAQIEYNPDDDRAISFTNVGSTKMMCPNIEIEDAIHLAMSRVASFSYTDSDDAQLLDVDGLLLMTLTRSNTSEQ